MSLDKTSKYISLILRHKPETIGITLDEHGWANVDELIKRVNKTHPLTMDVLEEIVRTDEKRRYSFNEDKTRIRANQGHSISIDVELEQVQPPRYLYHGTGEKFVSFIDAQGLIPKSRLYVHLSEDIETAIKVGTRHGKPVVYRVLAERMADAGFIFYKSVNDVWLTEAVPVEYLNKEENVFAGINSVVSEIKASFLNDENEETVLSEYKWDDIQTALITILLDDQCEKTAYEETAKMIWDAFLSGKTIQTDLVIGLLYYRLGNNNAPYDNNLIWSITSALKKLDYANADYNPAKDQAILKKLDEYDIHLS